MSSYDRYFLGFKNMDHTLSNALSTMSLRRLVMFLHFETYVLENPQNQALCDLPIYQLDFLPHIYMTLVTKGGGLKPNQNGYFFPPLPCFFEIFFLHRVLKE